jgi:hypothetical protein
MTSLLVFNRDYRLEIQSVMLAFRVCWRPYSAGVLHCLSGLFQKEPTKLLYHTKQKPRRGVCLIRINTCRKVLFHMALLSISLIFLRNRGWGVGGVLGCVYVCAPEMRKLIMNETLHIPPGYLRSELSFISFQ